MDCDSHLAAEDAEKRRSWKAIWEGNMGGRQYGGTHIVYRRWVHQNEYGWVGSVAPLDHRLGLIGDRVNPDFHCSLRPLRLCAPKNTLAARRDAETQRKCSFRVARV